MELPRSLAAVSLALVVAGTGAASAASSASSRPSKPPSKAQVTAIAKQQANKAITKRAPHLKVASAKKAGVGLSPVAYAVVNADGTVVSAASRGVTNANVTLEATSAYCFRNLGFAFKTAMTNPVYTDLYVPGTTSAVAVPGVYGYDTDCSPAAQLEVATATESSGTIEFAPAAFTIWFYN